jgi:hypothetical protein
MKLKATLRHIVPVLALSAFVAVNVSAEEKVLVDSLKIGNTVVKNVRVTDATPTHVTISFDGGGSRLKRQDLPPELKALYPYDAREVAVYERQQAADAEKRAAEERARQARFNRELKASLELQRPTVRGRIEQLEKELKQLKNEMAPMRAKAKGKPRSAARAELDAARDKEQDLIHRIGEQKTMLENIDKQLDHLP